MISQRNDCMADTRTTRFPGPSRDVLDAIKQVQRAGVSSMQELTDEINRVLNEVCLSKNLPVVRWSVYRDPDDGVNRVMPAAIAQRKQQKFMHDGTLILVDLLTGVTTSHDDLFSLYVQHAVDVEQRMSTNQMNQKGNL